MIAFLWIALIIAGGVLVSWIVQMHLEVRAWRAYVKMIAESSQRARETLGDMR